MKKRGFTLIELLIVIAIIGITVGIGTISIKEHVESTALLKVKTEVGDFFRLAANRSRETGKRYEIDFNLDKNVIVIKRNGEFVKQLELPNRIESGIVWGGGYKQSFSTVLKTTGQLNKKFTVYFFKSNGTPKINGDEELVYVISFDSDAHVKHIHIREYIPKIKLTASDILTTHVSPSGNSDLDLIKS